ncbi:MAG: sodium-dependent transporter [Oscillospiraceae bacterium]
MVEKETKRGFNSRWGLIATLIGLAVGTGNIWRFPREAAKNGGGAFLIAWTVMLLIAAIPLAIAEMGIGRATRRGCPGAFKDMLGKKYTWMGVFMTLIVVCIAGYYTVTMSWVLRYLVMCVTGQVWAAPDKMALFDQVSIHDPMQIVFFVASLIITWAIAQGGVAKSIEKFMKVCIPCLFVLLVVVAFRSLTIGDTGVEGAAGSMAGLEYFFAINPDYLFNGKTWISALIQILWSVGVGWGLVITYGAFTQAKSDVALNAFIQGFGNNIASLLAGTAIIPALFAFNSQEAALAICQSGANGLTFGAMTNIFQIMPGGKILAVMFFFALLLAALSSNLGHFLVGSLPLMDMGMSKKKASLIMMAVVGVWGLPSAWTIKFHGNQDFVSGFGLVIGILFTCFLVWKVGAETFRANFINIPENDVHCGIWWDIAVKFIAPITSITLIVYCLAPFGWGYIGADNMWNFFQVESFATLVGQLLMYLVVSIVLAKFVNNSNQKVYYNGKTFPEIPEEYD